jgi:LacI family transcriptional regulator
MLAQKMVSMKAISEKAGVSIATVSRVINQNGRFSEGTRAKVLSVIGEFGYTPNILAQGLRRKRTHNIGIIVPDITNEFFAKMTLHIQHALFEANYSTLIYNTDENNALEAQHLRALTAQNVSAIVFISGDGRWPHFHIPPVPTVFLDRKPPVATESANYINIHTDNFKGGYLAGKVLIYDVCKNPAVIMDGREISYQMDRLMGFRKAMDEANIPVFSEAIYKLPVINYETAYSAVCDALKKGDLYDSYFCTTDWLAIGAMTALLDHNISIPGQARIVGFDNISITNYCRVPLTTIHQDIKGMADKTVEILIDILNGEEIKEWEFVFEPSLVKRQTA